MKARRIGLCAALAVVLAGCASRPYTSKKTELAAKIGAIRSVVKIADTAPAPKASRPPPTTLAPPLVVGRDRAGPEINATLFPSQVVNTLGSRTQRLLAYTLGAVVGQTVLGRANGAASDAVQRQTSRADTLAGGLGVTVAPFPEVTGKRPADGAAGLDYILDGGGKLLTQSVSESHGVGEAALLELGMKTSVARMLYLPRGSTNPSFVSVFDRTSTTASLKTPTVSAAAAKIRSNASRADVQDALDAMEDAIKAELKGEGSEPRAAAADPSTADPLAQAAPAANVPVSKTTVSAASVPATPLSNAPAKPAAVQGGAAQVAGRLPPEVISRIVRANMGRFRLCYENGLRSNPSLKGKVTTRFVIDRSGAVSTAADGGSDLPDRQVVQCVVRGFANLSFPQPEGAVVTVSYPIVFNPGG